MSFSENIKHVFQLSNVFRNVVTKQGGYPLFWSLRGFYEIMNVPRYWIFLARATSLLKSVNHVSYV